MAKATINLQDSFLNQVRKDNTSIDVVMLDGSELHGHVRGFDNFTVIIQTKEQQHLIYKHAIAQIIQSRAAAQRSFGQQRHHHGEVRSTGQRSGSDRPSGSRYSEMTERVPEAEHE